MRYILIIVLIINFTFNSLSKDCECINEFNSIKQVIETNHPYYQLNYKNNPSYLTFADSITNVIKNQSSNQDCIFFIKEYLSIFNDFNLDISPNYSKVSFDENNKNDIFSLQNSYEYKSTESINLDTSKLKLEFSNKMGNSIEGFYNTSDIKFKIAIIKDKTNKWDLLGVVVDSKSGAWLKGQIKYYFKKKSESVYWVKILNSFHKPTYEIVNTEKDYLKQLDFSNEISNNFIYTDNEVYELNNAINYIRIPSFDYDKFSKLENLLSNKGATIKSKSYLVLDLRGNSGENESFVKLLLNFFGIESNNLDDELWVTNTNTKLYEDNLTLLNKEKKNLSESDKLRELIIKMKNSKVNSFLSLSNTDTSKIINNASTSKIQRIFILQDSKCAKACERFIQIAKQSGKAISLGERTSGNIAFDNKVNYQTICGNLLSYSTSINSKFIPYEIYGIKPNIATNYNIDLIDIIQKYLISN